MEGVNSFPSNKLLTFLIPLSLQCLFIHPIFPTGFSRLSRFVLMFPSAYYSLVGAFRYGFEPRVTSIGVNFVLGVMSAYAAWKSIEWGLAVDRTPYTWIGFPEDGTVTVLQNGNDDASTESNSIPNGQMNGNGSDHHEEKVSLSRSIPINTPSGRPREPKDFRNPTRIKQLRLHYAATDSPLQIIWSTFHLLLSMRGNGYAFGKPRHLVAAPPVNSPGWSYLLAILSRLLVFHCLFVLCACGVETHHSTKVKMLGQHLPSLSEESKSTFADSIGGISLGFGAFSGMTLGFHIATLIIFVITAVLRQSPFLPKFLTPNQFDPRQYPPLFISPYAPTSVAGFWSVQWHSFFTRPFKFLGFDPIRKTMRRVVGEKGAVALATMGVFAWSAWLHEQALWSATIGLPPFMKEGTTPFMTRWGATFYFLIQGIAIILEGVFTAVTGRKVRGPLGMIWSIFWMGILGAYVNLSWTSMGLTSHMPEVHHWGWQRFWIPLGAMAPSPMWTK